VITKRELLAGKRMFSSGNIEPIQVLSIFLPVPLRGSDRCTSRRRGEIRSPGICFARAKKRTEHSRFSDLGSKAYNAEFVATKNEADALSLLLSRPQLNQ